MKDLPEKQAGESDIAFAIRVAEVFRAHIRACRSCLDNLGCFACEAEEESEDPRFHACNCDLCDPKGYGYRLKLLYNKTKPMRRTARQLGLIR